MAEYPPGYRFVPNDEELIDYLKMRIRDDPIPVTDIRDANAYGSDPKNLIAKIFPEGGNREKGSYFFTPRDRKYPNGSRPNRRAGNGYWKATGADRKIRRGKEIIGNKRVLNFLTGQQPNGQKTRWLMHEYTLPARQLPKVKQNGRDMRLNDWVLCHIYERALRKSDNQDYDEEEVMVDDNPAENVQVLAQDIVPVPEQPMLEAFVEAHYTTTPMVPAPAPAQFDGFVNDWLLDQPYVDGEGTSLTNYYEQLPPLGDMRFDNTSNYQPPPNNFDYIGLWQP